jgi:hypothetical protein
MIKTVIKKSVKNETNENGLKTVKNEGEKTVSFLEVTDTTMYR